MSARSGVSWLERLRGHLEPGAEPPPVARLIGFAPVEIDVGRAVFLLRADPAQHANPMGTMHGGVLVDVGDAAMGFAMASTLEADESFTTIEGPRRAPSRLPESCALRPARRSLLPSVRRSPPRRSAPRSTSPFRAASSASLSLAACGLGIGFGAGLTGLGVLTLLTAGLMSADGFEPMHGPPEALVIGGSVSAAVGLVVLFIGLYMMVEHLETPPTVVRF